jgi:hypothetical protein
MTGIYAAVGLYNSTPCDDLPPFDGHLDGSTLDPETASLIASIPAEEADPYEDACVDFCVSCDLFKRDTVRLDIDCETVTLCLDCYDAAKAEADRFVALHPVWYGGSE